jgi:hypothetical protein
MPDSLTITIPACIALADKIFGQDHRTEIAFGESGFRVKIRVGFPEVKGWAFLSEPDWGLTRS